jgi:hypothetical protein
MSTNYKVSLKYCLQSQENIAVFEKQDSGNTLSFFPEIGSN